MQLGVLDIRHPRRAPALAARVEHLGYARYWLGEHHGYPEQGGSPEVLAAVVAAATTRIRVGTAGVLLRYYAPFKVAQSFRVLEDAYFPRIDLGVARGAGADPPLARVLLDGRVGDTDDYERRVDELARLLQGRLPSDHPLAGVPLFGRTAGPSDFWVLGTTARAARLAGRVGACFAFSEYLARMADADVDGSAVVRAYREAFQPAPGRPAPRWNVAIAGAATDEAPDRLAVMPIAGPPPLVAGADAWRRRLGEVAERYETDEIVVLDLCERFDDRLASLALLAEAAGLAVPA